jgi:GNAT superfamily N-acetyltransferase
MRLQIERLDSDRHNREGFQSGRPEQDEYLHRLASQHGARGISRSYVLVDLDNPRAIIGYYTLSACQLVHAQLTTKDQRRLPRYPIPGIRIGQLAVDQRFQRCGHGALLLGSAIRQALKVQEEIGLAVVVVDARDEGLLSFYREYGFISCSDAPLTLYLPLGKRR